MLYVIGQIFECNLTHFKLSQVIMKYYYTKILNCSLQEAHERTLCKFKERGFGLVSEMDVSNTLKEKIGLNFKPYLILGLCNPFYASEVLKEDDKMGVLLPCSVTIQEHENGKVEVSAINPVKMVDITSNESLRGKAEHVAAIFKEVIEGL